MVGAVITHLFVTGGSAAPASVLFVATGAVAFLRRPNSLIEREAVWLLQRDEIGLRRSTRCGYDRRFRSLQNSQQWSQTE
jgi:hypothetical protein